VICARRECFRPPDRVRVRTVSLFRSPTRKKKTFRFPPVEKSTTNWRPRVKMRRLILRQSFRVPLLADWNTDAARRPERCFSSRVHAARIACRDKKKRRFSNLLVNGRTCGGTIFESVHVMPDTYLLSFGWTRKTVGLRACPFRDRQNQQKYSYSYSKRGSHVCPIRPESSCSPVN